MKVLVVDDEKLVADLISDFMRGLEEVSEVFQINDPSLAIEFIERNSIDLVFLDLYMPNFIGLEILKEIRSKFDNVKVVILSSHFESKYIHKALELNVNGYLSKSISKSEILKTLSHIAEDKVYLCSECYRELEYSKMHETNTKFSFIKLLTKREIEVLIEIADGLSSQEIADKLFISKDTVETHKKHLFEKFGVKKVTQLVKTAYENNII